MLRFALCFCGLFVGVSSFAVGAPETVCLSMTPNHGSSVPQSGVDFSVTPAVSSFATGETINIVIKALGTRPMNGILIQARPSAKSSVILGRFVATTRLQQRCVGESGQLGALTHTERLNTRTLNVQWQSPANLRYPEIIFFVTIVNDYERFWHKVASPVITVNNYNQQLSTTTVQPQTQDTALPKVGSFKKPVDCVTADGTCDIHLTWKKSQSTKDSLDITITSNKAGSANDYYVAIGIAPKEGMDGQVVMCLHTSSREEVVNAKNEQFISTIFTGAKRAEGISNGKIERSGNTFSCSFTRTIAGLSEDIDLWKTKVYVISAHGRLSGPSNPIPLAHARNARFHTKTDVYFLDVMMNQYPVFKKPANCVGTECDIVVTWSKSQTNNALDVSVTTYKAPTSGDYYIAVGVALEEGMTGDVIMCLDYGGQREAVNARNEGFVNTILNGTRKTEGLSAAEIVREGTKLQCNFTRSLANMRIDIRSNPVFIIAAHAKVTQGVPQSHLKSNRFHTKQPIDLIETAGETPAAKAYSTKPKDCISASNCNLFVTWSWSKKAKNSLDVIIVTNNAPSSEGHYLSAGFTKTEGMEGLAVMCISVGDKTEVINTENQPGNVNVHSSGAAKTRGITAASIKRLGNSMECRFTRSIVENMGSFDLQTTHVYVVAAHGSIAKDGVNGKYHGKANRLHTPGPINVISSAKSGKRMSYNGLQQSDTNTNNNANAASGGNQQNTGAKQPARTGGEFKIPDSCTNDCSFHLTWVPSANTVDISMTSHKATGSNYWIAFGQSSKPDMSGSVIMCIHEAGSRPHVLNAVNVGHVNELLTGADRTAGNRKVNIRKTGSTLQCNITRDISPTGKSTLVKLNQAHYIIYAVGSSIASNGKPNIHDKKGWSSKPITLSSHTGSVSGSSQSNTEARTLIKLHGSLMCTAWMMLASMGIMMARYFKPLWSDLEVCGVKIWFVFHRTLMVVCILFVIAGITLIVIETKATYVLDYKNNYVVGLHPALGIVVTGFGILNPLIALCRCHPGDADRWIFNWIHWFFGAGAHLMANVNLLIVVFVTTLGWWMPALNAKLETKIWITLMMVLWFIFHLFTEFTMQKKQFNLGLKNQKIGTEMQLQAYANNDGTLTKSGRYTKPIIATRFKSTVFSLYSLVTFGVVVAFVITLCLENQPTQ